MYSKEKCGVLPKSFLFWQRYLCKCQEKAHLSKGLWSLVEGGKSKLLLEIDINVSVARVFVRK